MTRKEILDFIEANRENGKIDDYFAKCYDQLKDVTKRSNQLTIYAIIIIVVF